MSQPETRGNPLSAYTKLSPSVYIHEPQLQPESNGAPKTIILASWMNAPPRALIKYVTEYIRLVPTARIIIILSSSKDFMTRSSKQAQRARLAPAVKALRAWFPSSSSAEETTRSQEQVFIHMFSNGGVFSTINLLSTYQETVGRPLRISSTILDSAPGVATVSGAMKAFSYALPSQWLFRQFTKVVLWLFFVLGALVRRLVGLSDAVGVGREAMNDQRLVPGEDGGKPRRCYIYSEADELVDWRDVERHADEAEARGWVVSREKFVGSPHVSHMRADPERYWGIVKRYLLEESE
ncbi:indole-diterpene biosynthesis protein PaxU [Aspergillus nomiae NRRL 13137]|uniref:Indole-diterpene biosynthesis protein PaxU n=1 Tax=Aspergillus nomiae NRRL (strain ATCC 15546 / NRRL 13137 / CBS 260.88 / M93) TaxID=1509407 RepID=A0A0L1IVY9_ASPN3|nr:indole-diterpene biosynthesis protein PaxU [Aspergillus nomiae NRRL 13137]KNG83560.1 indole-diterpene biosynthesis protein PaxU [Aspergillus nomiae NRRL 13137]